MPLRPFRCYRRLDARPYTQMKYIRGVPGSKIVIFDMGGHIEKFPVVVTMYSNEPGQIRHNALEAARVMANRYLMKRLGKSGYHLKIRIYPHHVLRENAMATGAGADRYQTGMRGAFGRPVAFAARVRAGQAIATAWVPEGQEEVAREALRRAKMKLPMPCSLGLQYVKVDEARIRQLEELERLEREKEARRTAEIAEAEAQAEAVSA